MGGVAIRSFTVALCIDPPTQQANPSFSLVVPGIESDVARVGLLTATGEGLELEWAVDGADVTVAVPVGDLPSETARDYGVDTRFAIGYVVIDLQAGDPPIGGT